MRFLVILLAFLILVPVGATAFAAPPNPCIKNPSHPKCPKPTPTATIRPTPTATPVVTPTPVPTIAPTPTPTPIATSTPTITPTPTVAPTPTPTVTPTPIPTIAPTPSPTATPIPAGPFAPPVTTGTFTLPATADTASEINSFIAGIPNGSIVEFRPEVAYSLDTGLLLAGRNNLVLDGNSATLTMNGTTGNDEADSTFLLRGSSHIRIVDFTVHGDYATFPGQAGEVAHLIGLSGWYGGGPSSYIEMSNVTGDGFFGDFAYLEGENVGTQRPSTNVWIHHNNLTTVGRNGVSLINVTDVLIENNTMTRAAYHMIDFEPNFDAEEVRRVVIRDNTFGSYAHRSGLIGFFVSFYSPNNPQGSDFTIENNTVAGIAANGYDGTARSLNSSFVGKSANKLVNVVFKNNSTSRTVSGYGILYFNWITGVTVTGNTQPVQSGSTLVVVSNSTNVVSSPNP